MADLTIKDHAVDRRTPQNCSESVDRNLEHLKKQNIRKESVRRLFADLHMIKQASSPPHYRNHIRRGPLA
jgi:hypothetical protein